MGQYYKPTLISADGKVITLYSHDYGSGLKLMEHSYIGNEFVNAVLLQIWHKPTRIAWIGDYANDKNGDIYEEAISWNQFMRFYKAAWGARENMHRINPKSRGILTVKNNRRFLVNHDKKSYIDLKEYVELNKWHEEGEYFRRFKNGRGRKARYSYDMCINPLPLLTACGNDRGGGDYRGKNPDFDKVGTWAFDHIELTGIRPSIDFTPVMYGFKED